MTEPDRPWEDDKFRAKKAAQAKDGSSSIGCIFFVLVSFFLAIFGVILLALF